MVAERPRDSFWSRVKNAEFEFAADYPDHFSYAEEKKLCDKIARSAWWRKRRADIAVFEVRHSGRTTNYCICAFQPARKLAAVDIGSPDTKLPDVLHAVAHYLHPENTAWHGPEYAKAMLDMVGKFLGMDERRRLAELYKKHKVKTVVWSQEAKERAKSRYAERDLKALLDELKSGENVTPSS